MASLASLTLSLIHICHLREIDRGFQPRDPILAGVVSSTEGMASAGLTLQGQGRKADLEGEIRVAGLKTTVDFTQVTLSLIHICSTI